MPLDFQWITWSIFNCSLTNHTFYTRMDVLVCATSVKFYQYFRNLCDGCFCLNNTHFWSMCLCLSNYNIFLNVQTSQIYFGILGKQGNELNDALEIHSSNWTCLFSFILEHWVSLLNLSLIVSSCVKWESYPQAA